MSLNKKIILALSAVALILISGTLAVEYPRVKDYVYEDAKRDARHMRQVLMSTRRVFHQQFLESGIELSDKTLGFLPAHAMHKVSDDVSSWGDDLFSFRNASDAPRNPENMAKGYELKAFDFFRRHPEEKEYFTEVSDVGPEHFFYFATPIYTEEYCLKCHGKRAVAPESIRKRYAAGYGHAVGDLQGVLSIVIPHDELYEHFLGHLRENLYAKGGIVAILLLAVYILLRRFVLQRVAVLKRAAEGWASGDYSLQLQFDSSDEISDLGNAYNQMISTILKRKSELRSRKEEVKKLSEELKTILEALESSIFLVSEDGLFIWMNAKGSAVFGESGEPEDFRCCDILPLFGLSVFRCPVHDVFRSGTEFCQEFLAKDGRVFEVVVLPLFDASGKVDRVILKLRDFTEKVRLREEIERAGRLATLGELSASLGHEINTPLATLLMTLPVMKEIQDDEMKVIDSLDRTGEDLQICGVDYPRIRERIPKLYESMIDAARRIKSISEDLKRFVRQERGSFSEVDLNDIVASSSRLCAHYIRKSTDRFEIDLCEGLPGLKGDRGRLEQVITNLIVNACQSLESRSSRIIVSTGDEKARGRIFVRVVDEGSGIEPTLLPRIKDPLFTTKADSGGTGLGLSLSQRIVEEHGGELLFESSLRVGTTVTLSLPCGVAESTSDGSSLS